MLQNVNPQNILFLDIETVPQHKDYSALNDAELLLWGKKAKVLARGEDIAAEDMYDRAGIYAEFGKIVCITVGALRGTGADRQFRLKSFASHDEKELLAGFNNMVGQHYNSPAHHLCGHNGKEFDFPYIARRTIINRMKLPGPLDIAGKKPWEISHLDTMELWKFGDFKAYTPLALLAHCFGIPTPKDDIDGSDVGRVYWEENDLERIVTYCEKDVLTLANVFLSMRGDPLIEKSQVTVA